MILAQQAAPPLVEQLGIATIIVLLILREVFGFLKERSRKRNGGVELRDCVAMIDKEFSLIREDNRAIRNNLQRISELLSPIATGVTVLMERTRGKGDL